nr:cysteine-rich receptor-like protein kinase 15 isoform X2 [Lolium perenne]
MPTSPCLVLLLLTASFAASQAGIHCGSKEAASPAASSPSPSPATNGTMFADNLRTLLFALPDAAAPTGFASLSNGTGRNRVFVRGICRGDSSESQCLADLRSGTIDLIASCTAASRRATGFYDKCIVTYADINASTAGFSFEEDELSEILYDGRRVADPDNYEKTYYALMKRLVARAASGNGSASARTSMFATGEAEYNRSIPNGTMYGLVQCMRDLSASECGRCLQAAVPQLPTCCSGYQGGVVRSFNCHLRIQLYTYYDLALDAPPGAAAPSPPLSDEQRHRKRRSEHIILAVALAVGALLVLVVALVFVRQRRRRIEAHKEQSDNAADGLDCFSLQVLKAATSNFSIQNKLGEGGFGEVFKGGLQGGKEIAVKRLSQNSAQGFNELKNELVLANRLRHRNLVQLLGVCFQEKLLVYEYMPQGSLDSILFDPEKAHQLDWTRRTTIISGIARGLLYLHEESPLKIIHRDLKPSNVLLDLDMNPKISDFGLSRAFGGDQSIDITKRPVGTLGYMSPEYAYCGQVSAKSDMYSFGVIVLEIITGRRNNRSLEDAASRSLLSYVWEMWSTGSVEELVDPSLGGRYPESEALYCVQIGLLCVQENPSARPDASEVVLMLNTHSTSTALPAPSRPAFCFSQPGVVALAGGNPTSSYPSTLDGTTSSGQLPTPGFSENDVTISELQPR